MTFRRAPLLALLLALLQVANTCAFSIFGGGPDIDGDALSWDGDGDSFVPKKAFKAGDKYTRVTLTNWKFDKTANLSLPTTVKMLSLVNCRLEFIPDEVRALDHLEKLNLAFNQITSADGVLASAGLLQVLNLTNNNVANYSFALPALNTLDLSSNMLTSFPSVIFKSPLSTFAVNANGFQLAAVSEEQFDFFAGLADLRADFAAITSCKAGTLVTLKGNKICRVQTAVPAAPALVPFNKTKNATTAGSSGSGGAAVIGGVVGTTPAATVGVIVNPRGSGPSDSTYILAGLIALLIVAVTAVGIFAVLTRRRIARLRGKLHEDTPLFFDSEKRTTYQRELDAGDKLFPSNDQVLVTWRVDYDSVRLVRKIAKGAFGEVWVGRYRGTKGVSSGELSVSFSPSCPPKVLELAMRCVSVDPKARPSAAEVAYQLRQRDLLLG
ncbi:hypothetical protein PybrP1_000010 [[Pythium] brassicae (nom. inval.)]|nr:hypothetical protein PybrP1_000010 [[Pythium] brassicae (nom. inval.)]